MSYIQVNRESLVFEHLAKKRHSALVLLLLIAKRAKRTENHPDERLEIGECYVGDYETYGVTRQIYRSDLALLKSTNQITTRSTKRGTIAKLVSTDLFDINSEISTIKSTITATRYQPSTNHQLTTNNNDNNAKNEKNTHIQGELKKLSDDEIYRISVDVDVNLHTCKRKYKEIMELVDSGDFQRKYPAYTDLGVVLRRWIQRDLDRGYIERMTEVERISNQLDEPSKIRERNELIKAYEAKEAHETTS